MSRRIYRPVLVDVELTASTDSVRAYLERIDAVVPLNAEEEVDLAKRIEAGLFARERLRQTEERGRKFFPRMRHNLNWIARDGERAKQHMIEANLRLVVSLVERYTGCGLPLRDLIQEGNLGLIRAVERLDYAQGRRFSTHASWWIQQALSLALAEQARTIGIPVHLVERLNTFQRKVSEARQKGMVVDTLEDMARVSSQRLSDVRTYRQLLRQPWSLDELLDDPALSESVVALVVDDDRLEHAAIHEAARDALDSLDPRARTVLRMRFGFATGDVMTLEEIGAHFGPGNASGRSSAGLSNSSSRQSSATSPGASPQARRAPQAGCVQYVRWRLSPSRRQGPSWKSSWLPTASRRLARASRRATPWSPWAREVGGLPERRVGVVCASSGASMPSPVWDSG